MNGQGRDPERTKAAPPHARSAADVAADLGVDPAQGLAEDEVRRRRDEHGPNRLREAETRSAAAILIEQFRSMVIVILVVAGAWNWPAATWCRRICA